MPEEKNIKIYLDNCCYNRPYDEQNNVMVRLETEAKLYIQELIKDGKLDLVWSSVNDFENNDNLSPEKRERIGAWKNIATEVCVLNSFILDEALNLMKLKLHSKDALHIATAIYSGCNYFLTTDKKILNKNISDIQVMNPILFLEEYFNDQ